MEEGAQALRRDGVAARADVDEVTSSSGDSGVPSLIETARYFRNLNAKLICCIPCEFMKSEIYELFGTEAIINLIIKSSELAKNTLDLWSQLRSGGVLGR